MNVTIPAPAKSNVTADKLLQNWTISSRIYRTSGGRDNHTEKRRRCRCRSVRGSQQAGTAQGQYFDITWQAQTVKSGDSVLFTIQPKMNLTANATETFTITDNTTGNTIPITATVTVNPASHSLDISKTTLDFATAKKGYGEIAPREFTVTNNGNVTETLEQLCTDKFYGFC